MAVRRRVVAGHDVRGGMERFALAGLDYNYAGGCMDMGITAFFCLVLFVMPAKRSLAKILRWTCITAIILSMPAVMATLSRGAVLGILVGIGMPYYVHTARSSSQNALKLIYTALGGILAIVIVCALAWMIFGNEMRQYGEALWNWQQDVGSAEGGGRTEVFKRGIDVLLGASGDPMQPLFGHIIASDQCNHNIYLDAASYSGWPGLLILIWLTLYPCFLLRSIRTRSGETAAILCIYMLTLFVGLSLSFLNFKLLWISWAILVDERRLRRQQAPEMRAALGRIPGGR